MLGRVRRVVVGALGVGLVGWWLRLLAHSKQAPPEGRWRELRLDEDPT